MQQYTTSGKNYNSEIRSHMLLVITDTNTGPHIFYIIFRREDLDKVWIITR